MKRDYTNPPGIYRHPAYSSILTVSNPGKIHFFAGRCSTDENYQCFAPGDLLGQYRRIMDLIAIELESVGATWHDVVFRRMFTLDMDATLAAGNDPEVLRHFEGVTMPPSTLVGVTRLSDPDFLLEMDLMAITD